MSVLDILRGDSGNVEVTVYECRNCGEKYPEDVDECLSCGAEEIAHYDF